MAFLRLAMWGLLAVGSTVCGAIVMHGSGLMKCCFQTAMLHTTGTVLTTVAFALLSDHHYDLRRVVVGLVAFNVMSPTWICLVSQTLTDNASCPSAAEYMRWGLSGAAVLVYIQHLFLIRPRLRPVWLDSLITWPSSVYATAVVLATLVLPLIIWLPPTPFALPVLLLPLVLAVMGLPHSLQNSHWEQVTLPLHTPSSASRGVVRARRCAQRISLNSPLLTSLSASAPTRRPLRIVQLTDVHLGPYMTVERLNSICHTIVDDLQPDLVLLTGDYHTPGADHCPDALRTALQPLAALAGRTFACLGNHDKETAALQALVIRQLEAVQIPVLVDAATQVDVPEVGRIHIVGADYYGLWRNARQAAVEALCARFPVPPDAKHSILLLHDPSGFCFVPPDRGCLVLSGHTHGGHIGFLSCGSHATLVGRTRVPDHGVWRHGSNTLYVNRGQGFRSLICSFVLRVGVPNELSLLHCEG
eukprot:GGOE01014438.1.p1 GENE.GGOE01014438.1~~GGOE01014438.1.p1  ORF type:complete len:473 (+),score=106.24 GGOE01014438.1:42-1460(+)